MFEINDEVIYGLNGVCRIAGIGEKEICGKKKLCYSLNPVNDNKVNIIFPVDSTLARNRMRRILSKDELLEIIHSMPVADTIWVDDEIVRRRKFKEILLGNDRNALIKLIKTLYLRDKEKHQYGMKIRVSERSLMKDAERVLYEEFAYVLGIDVSQVLPFIISELGDS